MYFAWGQAHIARRFGVLHFVVQVFSDASSLAPALDKVSDLVVIFFRRLLVRAFVVAAIRLLFTSIILLFTLNLLRMVIDVGYATGTHAGGALNELHLLVAVLQARAGEITVRHVRVVDLYPVVIVLKIGQVLMKIEISLHINQMSICPSSVDVVS